jgi:tetratricopeptide (TPR) repeat protein
MRSLPAGIALLFAGVCLAAETPPAAAPLPCSNSAGVPACRGSAKDLKEARQAFTRGLKLEKSQKLEEALYEFEKASRLVPRNVEYLTAREIARQRLAGPHLERGNSDLLDGRQVEAMAEFRTALRLDPQNEFARQRISEALGPMPMHTARPQVVASAAALVAKPTDRFHDIHYRGDSRGLLTAIAASYGLSVLFDDNFPNPPVRFDLDNADFATAMQAASAVTKTFSVALEDAVLFAVVDDPENHRLYDRMGMRSFYIPGGNSAQDLQELTNSLRTLFEFKFVSLNAPSSTITVRGPQALLDAATQLLEQLASPPPEVMLDVKVFQVSHTYARQIGLHVPDTFGLYSLSSALSGLNSGESVTTILTKVESEDSSILSNPLATFGGGSTFFGLSLDQLSAELSVNDSSARQLDHVQLRASQQKDATFKMGLRYPIETSVYSSITSSVSASTLQSLGLSSSQVSALSSAASSTIPSVSYEDIGLMLKMKPAVHNNSDVALELEMQFRTLETITTSGMPNILNREFKGGILLKEGEPAVVAGMITQSDQSSLSGLPTFSNIAGFGLLTSQRNKQEEDDELLILITPYVVDRPKRTAAPGIWIRN